MVRVLSVAFLVLVAVSAVLVHGYYLKHPEREVVAELAAQILGLVTGPVLQETPTMRHSKRNAELINSLLGIPKIMTDAGRR